MRSWRCSIGLTFLMLMAALHSHAAVLAADPQPARIALVIANSKYADSRDSLPGARRDGNLIKEALQNQRLGFQVKYLENGTRTQIEAALREFQLALKHAGPSGIGLLYFVGHGAADASGSDNFLFPVDVDDVSVTAATQGLGVRSITERLELLDRRQAIIIVVDACRTAGADAKSSRTSRLVAPDEQKPGFLVALSTSKSSVASDSSPYAEILAKKLLTAGLTIDQVFQQVRQDVARDTQQRQIPTERSKTVDAVCLVSCQVDAKGAFTENRLLLDTTRNETASAMQRVQALGAPDRCRRGWEALQGLRNSAEVHANSGRLDTAGETFKAVTERAQAIESYLSTLDRIASSTKQLDALHARTASLASDAERNMFVSVYRRNFEGLLAQIAEAERTRRRPVDWAPLRKIESRMDELAAAGNYLDATERAIEGYNVALRSLEGLLGAHVGQPIPKEERMRVFRMGRDQGPPPVDTSMLNDTPGGIVCRQG